MVERPRGIDESASSAHPVIKAPSTRMACAMWMVRLNRFANADKAAKGFIFEALA